MTDEETGLVTPRPSSLTRDVFVARFGDVYDRSPWVAEAVWGEAGPRPEYDTVAGLAAAMAAAVEAAGDEAKLAILRAHAELAAGSAPQGKPTRASAEEQKCAGLDRCTKQELERFRELNEAYRSKFGFPFIVDVRGLGPAQILETFEQRLGSDPESELATALSEVHHIARGRLAAG